MVRRTNTIVGINEVGLTYFPANAYYKVRGLGSRTSAQTGEGGWGSGVGLEKKWFRAIFSILCWVSCEKVGAVVIGD